MSISRVIFCAVVVMCMYIPAGAQLCTGSLGDPVSQITFGRGTGAGLALAPSVTPYQFTSISCPTDGQYTIRNNTLACFSSSWHDLIDDHTPGDISGYYMLVNGAFTQGFFYIDTIRGLCSNTTYQLSAWFLNILKPGGCSGSSILPNVTFTVETITGTILATYNTGDLIEVERPAWREHGVFFNLPAGNSSIIVRFKNNALGGCGNEFAFDDITVQPCNAQLTAALAATNLASVNVCVDDTRSFQLKTAFAGTYNNPVYQWQISTDGATWTDIPGATSTTYLRTATKVGTYYYRMTIAEGSNNGISQCRVFSNPITIYVNSLPNAQVTNYVFGCYGSTVILFAAGGDAYRWKGPNGFTGSQQEARIPNVQFTNAGLYTVFVTDYKGCSRSDSTFLNVYPAANATKGPDATFCEGDSSIISAGGGIRYKWIPAKGLSNDTIPNPTASCVDSTIYSAVVYSQYGCTDTARIHVNVWKKPKANAGPDKKMRKGFSVFLDGKISGSDVTYTWTPLSFMSNTTTLHPKVAPPQDFFYDLKVQSNNGCGVSTDRVKVSVYDKVFIPNAFSPNGDGVNDTWIIEPLDLFEESVTEVYNRNGQVVYRSNGYSKPWDGTRNGKSLPVGTYYYSIFLTSGEPRLTGYVVIVR